jgi:hypothetical protein
MIGLKHPLTFEYLEPRQMLAAHPIAGPLFGAPTVKPAIVSTGVEGSGHMAPSRLGIAPWRPPGMVAQPLSIPSQPARTL